MPTFSTAPIESVIQRPKTKQPSQRAQQREEYREALRGAIDAGEALVIEMEPEDKALTLRNRLQRAMKDLGRDDVKIRRKGNRVLAYVPIEDKGE